MPSSQVDIRTRWDGEYYDLVHFRLEASLERAGYAELASIAQDVRCGPFGSAIRKEDYCNSGIPLIRVADTSSAFVKTDDLIFVDEEKTERELTRYIVRPGDIVVSQRGTIAQFAMVANEYERWVISANLISIRQSRKIVFGYLLAFLNSQVGIAQIMRLQSGQVQPKIITDDVKSLQVYVPPVDIQKSIGKLVHKSHQSLRQSQSLYSQAEALLLAELGLQDLPGQDSSGLTYTHSFSHAAVAGRWDAEHFQPKYYTLLDRLQQTAQAIRLGDWLTEPIKRGALPEYDENGEIIVINSQHVGKTHVELEDNRRTTRHFAEQNPKAVIRRYDVLLNSTGYITIGRCQTFLDDVMAVVDGHVSIIRPKKGLDPVYLGFFLNSPVGQLQTERGWTGSSGQIELRREVIEDYLVWKPEAALQKRLRELVEKSHIARQQAHQLLEEAKRRVEEMILR